MSEATMYATEPTQVRDHVKYAEGVARGLSASEDVAEAFRQCWMMNEKASVSMAREILLEEHYSPILREAVVKEIAAAEAKRIVYLNKCRAKEAKESTQPLREKKVKSSVPKPGKWNEPRPCEVCKNEFIPTRGGQLYCSRNCGFKGAYEKAKEAKGPLGPKPCRECQTLFDPPVPNQIYCSEACNRRALYRKTMTVVGVSRVCRWCETQFTVTDPRYPYWCSKMCVNAYKKQQRDKKKQQQKEGLTA